MIKPDIVDNSWGTNNNIMTPSYFAKAIIEHFNPSGLCLDPCMGEGAFYNNLPHPKDWAEIQQGHDFLDYKGSGYDWIITNPPWSGKSFKPILKKSLEVADNVVFLMKLSSMTTIARLKIIHNAGFSFKEILLLNWPEEWVAEGYQLAAIHWAKGKHNTRWTDLKITPYDNFWKQIRNKNGKL